LAVFGIEFLEGRDGVGEAVPDAEADRGVRELAGGDEVVGGHKIQNSNFKSQGRVVVRGGLFIGLENGRGSTADGRRFTQMEERKQRSQRRIILFES
jgi:hypothetical protein